MRKLFWAAVAAALASAAAYAAAAWITICALAPEHPEYLPKKLFFEALSFAPALILSFMVFELAALICAARRVAKASSSCVVSTAAEVSGLVALVLGLLSELGAGDWRWLLGSAFVLIPATVIILHVRNDSAHAETG